MAFTIAAEMLRNSFTNIYIETYAYENYLNLYFGFDKISILKWESRLPPTEYFKQNLQESPLSSFKNQSEYSQFEFFDVLDVLKTFFPDKHIYEIVFQWQTRRILENGPLLLSQGRDDHEFCEFLNMAGEDMILILGRNSAKLPQYNYLMKSIIKSELVNGRKVINATVPIPKKIFRHPNYIELPQQFYSYKFVVALMEKSLNTYVCGNAGGVNNHLLTCARITLVGHTPWVGDSAYGYQNMSLIDARRAMGVRTDQVRKRIEFIRSDFTKSNFIKMIIWKTFPSKLLR